MQTNASLRSLDDQCLLRQFGDLVREDAAHLGALLRHMDEIDRRQLWAKAGFPSMFAFCVGRFHMSESMAGKRIAVARVARRYPILFDMVARGELHLSGILCLKTHLTDDNHVQLLTEAKHKTVAEIELIVARTAPRPDVPSRIRALPRRPARPSEPATAPAVEAAPPEEPAQATTPAEPRSPESNEARNSGFTLEPPPRAPDPKPLAPGRYALHMTLSEEGNANLRALQGLHAHQNPSGDPAPIVERALALLLEHTLKQKAALTDSARSRAASEPEPTARSRYIPAHVRRTVWQRDEGRCAFVADDGTRCNAARRIEFAHRDPYAKGGEHSVDNIALRCDAHNDYEASCDYGELFMASKRGDRDHLREPRARYVMAS